MFQDFDAALDFGQALACAPGIVKREIALMADPVPGYLKPLAEHLPPGCHALLLATAPASEPALRELVAERGGEITSTRTAEEGLGERLRRHPHSPGKARLAIGYRAGRGERERCGSAQYEPRGGRGAGYQMV